VPLLHSLPTKGGGRRPLPKASLKRRGGKKKIGGTPRSPLRKGRIITREEPPCADRPEEVGRKEPPLLLAWGEKRG